MHFSPLVIRLNLKSHTKSLVSSKSLHSLCQLGQHDGNYLGVGTTLEFECRRWECHQGYRNRRFGHSFIYECGCSETGIVPSAILDDGLGR